MVLTHRIFPKIAVFNTHKILLAILFINAAIALNVVDSLVEFLVRKENRSIENDTIPVGIVSFY